MSYRNEANDDVALYLNLSGGHRVTRRSAGQIESSRPRFGDASISPPGVQADVDVVGNVRLAWFRAGSVDVAKWLELAEIRSAGLEFIPKLHVQDADILRLFTQAMLASDAPGEIGAQLLVARLATHHSNRIKPTRKARGGIAPTRLRQIKEMMEARLSEPLLVRQLAAELHMGAGHFAREFTRSAGMPPHRFLTELRIASALEFIVDGGTTRDAAQAVGFAHRSHLSRHVKSRVGLNAEAFRRVMTP